MGAFDRVFAKATAGTSIPPSFLAALAKHESAMNPDAIGPGGERGLLQIHPVTLAAYNVESGENLSPDDSAKPDVNARIAVWLLGKIERSFAKNHPRTLSPDWQSRRWVGLVVQAYNAGESEINGVGKLVGRLEGEGVAPNAITHQTVAQANVRTRDNRWLSDPRRLAYIERVLRDYLGVERKPNPPAGSPG